MQLANAIVRMGVGSLVPHPRNARRGDVASIAESLRVNGQFAPLVVQASTFHVLAGNHTLAAARSLGWDEVAVTLVDVDDERALRILLAANATSDRSGYDDQGLLDLLESLAATVDVLDGTGFGSAELESLAAALQPEELPLPADAPVEEGVLVFGVVVVCADEAAQADLLERLDAEGFQVRAMVS